MSFSQKQIDYYISIIKKYTEPQSPVSPQLECAHQFEDYETGMLHCQKCGVCIPKLESSSSFNDYERCHFKKKSVYDRRYHFENKINDLIKKFDLNFDSETLDELYTVLNEINNKELMKKLNSEFKRKRLININFLIKKILEIINPNLAEKIQIKNAAKTLELYNNYWGKIKPFLSF